MRKEIIVKPNSKKGPLIEFDGDKITVFVNEKAADGKANAAVVKLLKKYIKKPVKIVKGEKSKHKIIEF